MGSSPGGSSAGPGHSWTEAFHHPGAFSEEQLSCTNPQRKARADLPHALSLTCHLLLQASSSPESTEPSACCLFIYLVKMSLERFMFQPFMPLREEIMEDLAGDAHTHQPRGPPHHLWRDPWEGTTLISINIYQHCTINPYAF